MKKILSMALASAMVLSMGTMAFAADPTYSIMINNEANKSVYDYAFGWDSDLGVIVDGDQEFAYGDTAYYALRGTDVATATSSTLVYEYDAVKGLKLKATWEMNGSLVEKVELVKKKVQTDSTDASSLFADKLVTLDFDDVKEVSPAVEDDAATPEDETAAAVIDNDGELKGSRQYAYFVGVSIKESTSTKSQFIDGEIALSKSAGKNGVEDKLVADENKFSVSFDVAYATEDLSKGGDNLVDKTKTVFTFDKEEDSQELEIIKEDIATFTVDTRGQDKLLLWADNKYDADIAAKYDANLEFIKTNGATFNRIGELVIYAEEGSYLYEIKADGTLVESKAKYSDYDEAFVLSTRTLGSYVIADEKLEVATAGEVIEVVEPGTVVETPVVVNPGTGVAL